MKTVPPNEVVLAKLVKFVKTVPPAKLSWRSLFGDRGIATFDKLKGWNYTISNGRQQITAQKASLLPTGELVVSDHGKQHTVLAPDDLFPPLRVE